MDVFIIFNSILVLIFLKFKLIREMFEVERIDKEKERQERKMEKEKERQEKKKEKDGKFVFLSAEEKERREEEKRQREREREKEKEQKEKEREKKQRERDYQVDQLMCYVQKFQNYMTYLREEGEGRFNLFLEYWFFN